MKKFKSILALLLMGGMVLSGCKNKKNEILDGDGTQDNGSGGSQNGDNSGGNGGNSGE